ncbi:NUDIX hydrolase [Nonomuraea maritima]|uniref:NUDIX hydrolase n=1 Tax=Nonomuraea maritima TaxID=683260 RepID=UPI0037248D77
MANDRAAARVLCLDGDGRVLLMRWKDTVSGLVFWEPPGGGIDPGETPLDAARRELAEETGLPGDAVLDHWTPVERDFTWLGVHYVKVEPFYLARFDGRPEVTPSALTAEESDTYLGFGWFTRAELAALSDPVQPPHLADVMKRLTAAAGDAPPSCSGWG